MSPITEQANLSLESPSANQSEARDLNSLRASSLRKSKPKPVVTICDKCGTCYDPSKAAPNAYEKCPTCRLRYQTARDKALQFKKMRTLFNGLDEDGFNATCTLAAAPDGTIMQCWHHRERMEFRWKPLPEFSPEGATNGQ